MSTYVGLDVHKKVCHATVMDERGEIVKEGKFRNERAEFEYFFKSIDDAKVAMEAISFWQPVYELLEDLGHEVMLSHPKKTRAIAEMKIKTDARDSKALAQLLRLDWLPTSYVPPAEMRKLRDLVRLRTYLVMIRTRFKNKIRAELAKRWVRVLGRRTKHICAHFKGKFIPYGKGVLRLSNNRIKRYHSEIAPKIRSMRGIKNLERGPVLPGLQLHAQPLQEKQAKADFRLARPKA